MGFSVNPRDFISATEDKLGSMVLAHRRQFLIPYNQRPWAWKAKHLEDLWRDVLATLGGFFVRDAHGVWEPKPAPDRDPHFFGAFVFLRTDDSFEVVDGQQRLTAVSMLVSCLREWTHRLEHRSSDPETRAAAYVLKVQFTNWLLGDPRPDETGRLRVMVDAAYKGLYEALVVKPLDEASRKALVDALRLDFATHPHHRGLREGFEHLHRLVQLHVESANDAQLLSLLKALLKTLEDAFLCVWSEISKEAFAFEVFGCLNARGQDLSESDKIKNELFIHAPKAQHGTVSEGWRQLASLVPSGDIGEFLRRRHVALYGDCPKNALFRKVRDVEIAGSPVPVLVASWLSDARLLKRILDQADFDDHTREELKALRTLGVSLGNILLLGAARSFLDGDRASFRKAARLATVFSFRARTICRTDTSELERAFGAASRLIVDGSGLSAAADELMRRNPDVAFEGKFGDHVERRVHVQYYILYCLEKHLAGGAGLVPFPHGPKQHIEHVLPQRLSNNPRRAGEWNWARSAPDLHNAVVNRLGNLCILESDVNKEVSNYEFVAKQTGAYPGSSRKYKGRARKSYADSVLKLPTDLANTSKHVGWTDREIEQRQLWMAGQAVKIWRF